MDRYTRIDYDFTPESHTVNNSSAQSSVVTTGSGRIRLAATTTCHVKFGSNPTATTNDPLLPADQVEIFEFKSGDKVAFIHHGTGSGKINISAVD